MKMVTAKPKPAVAKTGDSFIQPDYDKWSQVKKGMTEAEVLDLLGKPLERKTEESVIASMRKEHKLTEAEAEEFFHRVADRYGFVWLYGQIKYESPVIPYPYQFRLVFVQGQVALKGDPFNGRLSPDGKPTTPISILPSHGTLFKYSPRFVDMRWEPSSGEYPMEYQIEVSNGQHDMVVGGKVEFNYYVDSTLRTRLPHVSILFESTEGRWKVKARNRLGESGWSAEHDFYFEV